MNKYDIVYVNNNNLGHFVGETFKLYSKDEKANLLNEIKNKIIKKDSSRKLCSLIVGILLLITAVVLFFLLLFDYINIGDAKWFNFTFLCAALVALWIILYYLLGFIFYSRLIINIHFKSKKSNSCITFASSNYCKYINLYSSYIKNTSLYKDKVSKNNLVLFGLKTPSTFKNIIFNGSIFSNIPYYYLTIKNQKYMFFPGFVIIVDKKNSMIIENNDFNVKKEGNTYNLYNKDILLNSFIDKNDEFNINFFYFKYE